MLTPVDVQNKTFKGGIGFDKKDVDAFMKELSADYEKLYRANIELQDKVTTLDESLQHYRSIEDSLQKALTLSEKTTEETIDAANEKARLILMEAEKKAESLVEDAKEELYETKNEIFNLKQQFSTFKEQYRKVLQSQIKILNGEVVDIDLGDFEGQMYNPYAFNQYGGNHRESGLGGLGGGYVGNNDNFEHTNQEPMYARTSLNMDPFTDAMNGGGRFSKHSSTTTNKKSRSDSIPMSGRKRKTSQSSSNVDPQVIHANFGSTAANQSSLYQEESISRQAEKSMNEQHAEEYRSEGFDFVNAETATASSTVSNPSSNTVTGEVEANISESKILDSEDNYATSFDFIHTESSEDMSKYTSDDAMTNTNYTSGTYSGEVENNVSESNMLDSEDNYATGFDYVNVSDTSGVDYSNYSASDMNTAYSGEVENHLNESSMLDSEDNYSEGFDYINESTDSASFTAATAVKDESAYVGEVEERVNESTMLDSEDNYNEGFDFVIGNESEEEDIPTIFTFPQNAYNQTKTNLNHSFSSSAESVLSGTRKKTATQSALRNSYNDDDGFKFM